MILTESIKSSFETVITLDAQIKKLTEERDAAKAKIRAELEKNKEEAYNENGYYALIAHGTRSSLVKAEVEKELGKPIPESCYKKTSYTTFTVKRTEMVQVLDC